MNAALRTIPKGLFTNPDKPYWFIGLGLAVPYFVLAKLGLLFNTVADNVTLIWPPTGLALFALLVFGLRYWPWIFIAAFITNLTTNATLAACVSIAVGNTLEAVTAVYLLSRANFDRRLARVRDVLLLLALAAGLSTMVSSTIGALSLSLTHIIPWEAFHQAWITWWMGDAMGALVVAPLLLSWWSKGAVNVLGGRRAEAILLVFCVVVMTQLVFGDHLDLWRRHLPISFLTFPFLTWAAIRFGMRGATGVVLLIGMVLLVNVVLHHGPFSQGTTLESLTLLWLYTNILAITSMVLAAAITERHNAELGMRHLAQHDHLTGLANRSALQDRINHAINLADRQKNYFAVLFLDIDRFKVINDSLGHAIGDAMLKEISLRLLQCVRKQDTVSRLGGDEFVVLVEEVKRPEDVYVLTNKILNLIREPINIKDKQLHTSASIGVCLYPHDGRDADNLLKHADIAMYRAKDLGRDTVLFYAAEMNIQAEQRMAIENDLRNALINHEFFLLYQPQYAVSDGRIKSAEALLRWNKPDGTCVGPADFIPVLEETGQIIPVGAWVIDQACRQCAQWQQAGWSELRIAVNLSSHQLSDQNLAQHIADTLTKYQLTPGCLELEITESMLVRQDANIGKNFDQLVKLGVQLAVDDFGTGYSSLSYLHRLSIDTLKIDRSFIEKIPGNEDSEAIARAIVGLGKSLRLVLVAEGIENEAQCTFVSDLGCDFVQGFLLSKPVNAEEFAVLLKNSNQAGKPFHPCMTKSVPTDTIAT